MQQMNSDDQRNYQGYEGDRLHERPQAGESYGTGGMYDDDCMDSFAQRLSQHIRQGSGSKLQPARRGASAGQRLALAIVSISLLAFIAMVLFTTNAVSSLVGLTVLSMLTVAFILINGIFNFVK